MFLRNVEKKIKYINNYLWGIKEKFLKKRYGDKYLIEGTFVKWLEFRGRIEGI